MVTLGFIYHYYSLIYKEGANMSENALTYHEYDKEANMELVKATGSEYGRRMYLIADEFARKCAEIIAPSVDNWVPKREKVAHTVKRTWAIPKGDHNVFYRSFLHYAPEIGYWICLKDDHGNLIFNSDAYILASTCRLMLMEKLYEIRGEVHP
jgi:hypothetical protein